ncbi:MAG: hypothetical protein CVU47_04140 [Chloroflexi bacterium HGW-Chloroflexi-9]|nr:MAG: hypothetical protein CVU47_04140 [Chloroflexi bacterium HGW-Chloroflexi-9]
MRQTHSTRLTRIAIATAAGLALLLGACSSDEPAPPTPTGTVVDPTIIVSSETSPTPNPAAGGGISAATPDEPPAGTFEVEGTEHTFGLGSYCWSPPTGSGLPAVCADAIGYITPPAPVTVAPGATLEITGGLAMAPIEVTSVRLWSAPAEPVASADDFAAWHPEGEGEPLAVTDGLSIALPGNLAPGRYLVSVSIISIDPSSSAAYSVILAVE